MGLNELHDGRSGCDSRERMRAPFVIFASGTLTRTTDVINPDRCVCKIKDQSERTRQITVRALQLSNLQV